MPSMFQSQEPRVNQAIAQGNSDNSSCKSKSIHANKTCPEVVRVVRWAEAHIQIARITLTIKLDRNWNSFQLANRAPPLSVTDSAIPFRKDAVNQGAPTAIHFQNLILLSYL
jgi:hypothetical protein